jgi:hypothetical protein
MGQRHVHPHGNRKSDQLRRDTPAVFCWAAEPLDGQTVRRSFRRCVYAEHHDGKHSWDMSDSDASDALKDELQDAVKNSLDMERAVRTTYPDDYTHAPMRHGTRIAVKPPARYSS